MTTWQDVWEGEEPVIISHAGGELHDLEQVLAWQLHGEERQKKKDTRDRANLVERRVLGFRAQQKKMVDAFMNFRAEQPHLGSGPPPANPESIQKEYTITVMDLLSTYKVDVPLVSGDHTIASCLVAQGVIPSSPWEPRFAVAIRVLELYRLARLRCPALGIQAWVRTMADLHDLPFKESWTRWFSVCFDLYLEILSDVEARVKKALGRDSPDWRLKNCCPCCTYELEGEEAMVFSMLITMDGNNSLKRILRKDRGAVDEEGIPLRGNRERHDPRAEEAGGDYFLSRERVNRWAKERLAEEVNFESDDPKENTECQERWKNLSEELTAKMWGIFDETGIFLALCRHGFTILLTDMVRSGELAKYPLAIIDAVLRAFPELKRLGAGYDVGCGFQTIIERSPLCRLAKDRQLKMLVGAFHGHAHNRKCQLDYLATYVEGLGIEDLEGCERKFSQSNSLAKCTRYASIFHRKQSIGTYFAHLDTFESYANLSNFLVKNYKQALEILATEDAVYKVMRESGVTEAIIEGRIPEEKNYLKGLMKEPEEETDQMEYYQQLVNLEARWDRYSEVYVEDSNARRVSRRHAYESYEKALTVVQNTETRLDIQERWERDSAEWQEAAGLVATRRYRNAVDKLERLVLQRIFEFAKVGQPGLAYKIRSHIANALRVRSRAIRTALDKYNIAASTLIPPGRQLEWKDVIDYAFLAEFDIIRDVSRHETAREWATPAARELLDRYHKLKRAKEEITRLNIEIKRFVTYMRDERRFLLKKEKEIHATDPHLAFFIGRYRDQRGRFDSTHMERLKGLKKLGRRFTGSLTPGKRCEQTVGDGDVEEDMEEVEEQTEAEADNGEHDEEYEDIEDDAEGEEVAEVMEEMALAMAQGDNETQ
ncbi:hypothetical protein R3P38DRAFT_3335209 [Favolaschia claudopus]|uniref:Uncharacterized protein n=1 Tax=Favolaschia claudopus TaxID=2862362 RepID=A0AAV9Z9G1_9AGAR